MDVSQSEVRGPGVRLQQWSSAGNKLVLHVLLTNTMCRFCGCGGGCVVKQLLSAGPSLTPDVTGHDHECYVSFDFYTHALYFGKTVRVWKQFFPGHFYLFHKGDGIWSFISFPHRIGCISTKPCYHLFHPFSPHKKILKKNPAQPPKF